jgi:hypothetical protein
MQKVVKTILSRVKESGIRVKEILCDDSGNPLVEEAGKIVIVVIIIGIVLLALEAYTNGTFLPDIWNKITSIFNLS